MKDKKFVRIILSVLFFLLMMGTIGTEVYAAEKIKWVAQSIFPAGDSLYKEFVTFAERVKVATNDRIEITTHPVGAIVGYREMVDAVKTNILQAYYSSPTFQSGKEPAFSVINNLPNCYDNVMQADSWFYHKGGLKISREAHSKLGTYPVGTVFYGREHLPSKVPLRTLADFKGKKIRVPEGVEAMLFTALGTGTVSMPGSELYTALEKGVIDAADWGTRSMNFQLGLHEVCKYSIEPGFHSMGALEFVVSKKTWDSLPKDLQQILESMVREWSWNAVSRILKEDAEVGPKLKQMGVEIISLPAEDYVKIRRISQGVWLEWAKKSPLCKQVIDSHIAFAKELGLF